MLLLPSVFQWYIDGEEDVQLSSPSPLPSLILTGFKHEPPFETVQNACYRLSS